MLFILLKTQSIDNFYTYMFKDRRQFEELFIEQDLMVEMRQVQKKVDFLIESHQNLIQLIKKSLPSLQVQTSTVRKQQIISPYIEQYSQVSGLLGMNSYEDTTQRLSFYDDYRTSYNQIHSRPSVLNHQSQQEEQQEKFRQMIEQEDFQQSNIQVPQAATEEVYPKEQDLFGIAEYKDSKIKLAHPQKILESLQSQLRSMNLNFNNCECLYAYPQMSNQSFFQKITDKQNVVFLAMLQNQQVIGAFTQIGFSSKTNLIPRDNPKCFLFNLTRNHFLYAQRTNKTHSCDKNYILFGNWQYKIKMGENIMNSDLGKRGDCFKKQKYGANQKEIANTRQWIFGQLRFNQSYRLLKYMVCALK